MDVIRIGAPRKTGSWRQGYAASTCYPPREDRGEACTIGALNRVDRIFVQAGGLVPMHAHRDEEMLTFLRSGTLLYIDSLGHEKRLTADCPMTLGAGHGVERELRALGPDPVDGLEIAFRPAAPGLEPRVHFHHFSAAGSKDGWRLLAGPDGAPLAVRSGARVHDARVDAGGEIDLPGPAGSLLARLLYVIEGRVTIGSEAFGSGECARLGGGRGPVKAVAPSHLLLVTTLPASLAAGTPKCSEFDDSE